MCALHVLLCMDVRGHNVCITCVQWDFVYVFICAPPLVVYVC